MNATTQTADRIVAIDCNYTLTDGRRARRVLIVPMADDPLYGVAVVNMRAEEAAASQLRQHAAGSIYTRVLASVPSQTLTPDASAPELTIDLSPAIGVATPYREHRANI
jgi:hypothetical protein